MADRFSSRQNEFHSCTFAQSVIWICALLPSCTQDLWMTLAASHDGARYFIRTSLNSLATS